MKHKKYIIGAVSFVAAFVVLVAASSLLNAPVVSADELNRQAYELRMKAMRGHCAKIGEKLAACYAGDASSCQQNIESETWFTNEYKETPEVGCASPDRPFGSGGVN